MPAPATMHAKQKVEGKVSAGPLPLVCMKCQAVMSALQGFKCCKNLLQAPQPCLTIKVA